MLIKISVDLQDVIQEVNDARDHYYYSKFESEAAWNDYSLFIDEDPRWENSNPTDAEMEAYRNKCSELLAWAEIAEKEWKEAWHRLDKAKTQLLKLQED